MWNFEDAFELVANGADVEEVAQDLLEAVYQSVFSRPSSEGEPVEDAQE